MSTGGWTQGQDRRVSSVCCVCLTVACAFVVRRVECALFAAPHGERRALLRCIADRRAEDGERVHIAQRLHPRPGVGGALISMFASPHCSHCWCLEWRRAAARRLAWAASASLWQLRQRSRDGGCVCLRALCSGWCAAVDSASCFAPRCAAAAVAADCSKAPTLRICCSLREAHSTAEQRCRRQGQCGDDDGDGASKRGAERRTAAASKTHLGRSGAERNAACMAAGEEHAAATAATTAAEASAVSSASSPASASCHCAQQLR